MIDLKSIFSPAASEACTQPKTGAQRCLCGRLSLAVALVIIDDARNRPPTRSCPVATSRCSLSCFSAPRPPPALLFCASPAPRLASLRLPRSLRFSLVPPPLPSRLFGASPARGLAFLRLPRSQPCLSAPPPLPSSLLGASFGSPSLEINHVGSRGLAFLRLPRSQHCLSAPPPLPSSLLGASFGSPSLEINHVGSETLPISCPPAGTVCRTSFLVVVNAACVPLCLSLRAWRCIVRSTGEFTEGPTDGRASWTRVLSLASTLSHHRLSSGILETLPVMVRVVYLLWCVIQLPCSCLFSFLGPSTGGVCGRL